MLRGLFLALSFLTRIPAISFREAPDARVRAWCFFFFPLTGAFMGLAASIPLLLVCFLAPQEQAVILFCAAVYPALLEWQARYLHFDGFCDCCDAFAAVGATPEKRLEILKDSRCGSAALGCGGFLIAAKVLGVYLLFTRTVLFSQDPTFFLFALCMIPALGRLSMLMLASSGPYPRKEGGTGAFIVGQIPRKVLASVSLLVFFLCGIYLALCLRFGTLFSFQSSELTAGIWKEVAAALTEPESFLRNLFSLGMGLYFSLLVFALAVVLPVVYWHRQAMKLLGGITGDVLGAAGEISELAAIFAFLLIIERF